LAVDYRRIGVISRCVSIFLQEEKMNIKEKCCVALLSGLAVGLTAGQLRAQTAVFEMGEYVVEGGAVKKEDPVDRMKISQKTLKAHKVVDLAEILSDELIEAVMVRKSGYGNEVGLRGFTKSNLRFTQDGTLIEGACGSRKDPPLSHINMLTVKKIDVEEGPFDVSIPGSLGGTINVQTKDPQEGFHGEFLSKFGSYDYLSQGGYITGGNKKFKGLFGYNYSRSAQYKDGAGDKLSSYNPAYNSEGTSHSAFEKHDFWGKAEIKTADNQKLELSSSFGEAYDILTPRVGMDTKLEKTSLNKAVYSLEELGKFSKKLVLSAYYNYIGHDPYGKFRSGGVNNKTIKAVSAIAGAKVENKADIGASLVTLGGDFYTRNWRGNIYNRITGELLNEGLFPDVNEDDAGLYLKAERDIGKLSVDAGARLDVFRSKADGELKYSRAATSDNARTDVLPSANVFLKYFINGETDIFGGVGLTNRIPNAVERYVQESSAYYGNPELDPARNAETDLGVEMSPAENLKLRTKVFYSYVKDFIYQQISGGVRSYGNIDAYLYGGDITASLDLGKGFGLNGGLAYQRGRKLDQPAGNTDKDLAEIAPLKTKLAAAYDRDGLTAVFEWVHSEKDRDIDSSAGETSLKGWNVFNFRAGYQFAAAGHGCEFLKGFSVNAGVDNIFDREYAVANSYEYDPTDPSGANALIVNEPGRFFYGSLSYKF